VCVLHHGYLVGTLSQRTALRSTLYRPAVDANGRLIVAAAVGINGDVAAKARALAAAGVDVLVVDTAHGHQEGMLRALQTVASLGLGIPIAAGNIVTGEGARSRRGGRFHPQGRSRARRDVHDAHDDGRRAPAVLRRARDGAGGRRTRRARLGRRRGALPPRRRARARRRRGIRHDRILVRGHHRSARAAAGRRRWACLQGVVGMASTKAVRGGSGRLDPYERAQGALFAEGISSSKICLDPLRPSVEDLVDTITSGCGPRSPTPCLHRPEPRAWTVGRHPRATRRARRSRSAGSPRRPIGADPAPSAASRCRKLLRTMDDPPSCRRSPHRPSSIMIGGDV
jgi:IMP dehydrogenase